VKKPQVNYAFIDGNNLHLSVRNLGWKLDYTKFITYLREHYGVVKAYYFIGRIPENQNLYRFLKSAGYTMKFKEISINDKREVKGNVDSEIVLQAMLEIEHYEKAILVSSDGDFACLVDYLRGVGKLECVLSPSKHSCSHLLKKAAGKRVYFVEELRKKVEYKK
jgi:uncharacterized LabA/DUF88 family protein